MNPYVWTNAAVRDLNDIYDYVAVRDAAAAERLIEEFDRKADLYAGNPLLGEARSAFGRELRVFRVSRYVVYYKPHRDGIMLYRIVHSSRNFPKDSVEE